MANYIPPQRGHWSGRSSGQQYYLHEKIQLQDLDQEPQAPGNGAIGLLGYCCDLGVGLNEGRIGAAEGPKVIREQLGKMPNHLTDGTSIYDCGDLAPLRGDLPGVQEALSEKVNMLLQQGVFPLVLGGGHDIALGHYRGIRQFLGTGKKLGILNLDAHLDLRDPGLNGHSGSPFYQISEDCRESGADFSYLCMGVRSDANDPSLFARAQELGVEIVPREVFRLQKKKLLKKQLMHFLDAVDQVYLTIDLDGFSSAYAPGVSAASPMGFAPDVVLEVLKWVVSSGKLIAADLAELNPTHDRDGQTAKLAASLAHRLIHSLPLL